MALVDHLNGRKIHVPAIERFIKVVKERVLAIARQLPFETIHIDLW